MMNWCVTLNRRWKPFIFLAVKPGDFLENLHSIEASLCSLGSSCWHAQTSECSQYGKKWAEAWEILEGSICGQSRDYSGSWRYAGLFLWLLLLWRTFMKLLAFQVIFQIKIKRVFEVDLSYYPATELVTSVSVLDIGAKTLCMCLCIILYFIFL